MTRSAAWIPARPNPISTPFSPSSRPSTAPCCWPACWRRAIWGRTTSTAFDAIYPDLAKHYGVGLYPFFLEGVAANPALNQADGLHPTAEGVAIIVRGILPALRQVIAKAGTPS